jgi:anthranilate/para-aminobenzoate synthase component I
MNKNDIEVRILVTKDNQSLFPDKVATIYDDVFRQPKGGTKVYSDPIYFSEIAQFKNKKFQKWSTKDEDNNGLETDARLVFSKEDWEEIFNQVGCYLKKGDLITSVAGNLTKLIIDEVKPTGFLNGENNLYFINLKDHNVVIGGII